MVLQHQLCGRHIIVTKMAMQLLICNKCWIRHLILSLICRETHRSSCSHIKSKYYCGSTLPQQLHSHFNVLWLLKPLRNLTLNFLFVRDEHNFKPFIQRPQREAYVSENSWETSLSKGHWCVKHWKRKGNAGLPGFIGLLSTSHPPLSIPSLLLSVHFLLREKV